MSEDLLDNNANDCTIFVLMKSAPEEIQRYLVDELLRGTPVGDKDIWEKVRAFLESYFCDLLFFVREGYDVLWKHFYIAEGNRIEIFDNILGVNINSRFNINVRRKFIRKQILSTLTFTDDKVFRLVKKTCDILHFHFKKGDALTQEVFENASKNGCTTVVKGLLAVDGISANDVRANNNYALQIASCYGHFEIVKLLLTVDDISANDVRANNNYVLRQASENGYAEVVKLLLAVDDISADDLRANNNYALRWASRMGHTEVVRLLLAVDGIGTDDVRAANNEALRSACNHGEIEVVRLLLAVDGIGTDDVRAANNEALRFASIRGHTEVVRLLLAIDGIDADDVRAENNHALLGASQNNHTEVMKLLLAVDGHTVKIWYITLVELLNNVLDNVWGGESPDN